MSNRLIWQRKNSYQGHRINQIKFYRIKIKQINSNKESMTIQQFQVELIQQSKQMNSLKLKLISHLNMKKNVKLILT